MNQHVVPPALPADGAQSMQRLADRLTGLVPPPAAAALATPLEPAKPSAAVTAALKKSAARAAKAQRKAARAANPLTRRIANAFALACSYAVPYSLVAFAVRLIMARVLFLDGQVRALGPQMSVNVYGVDISVVLPLDVNNQALSGYYSLASLVSLPPALLANAIGVAQFLLPLMLVLGFATRFAALVGFALVVLFDVFVMPQALWTAHIYWGVLLLLLVSQGPGIISLDRLLRGSR